MIHQREETMGLLETFKRQNWFDVSGTDLWVNLKTSQTRRI
jgi:hypothetical protein